jgi:hypothetical protein
MLERVIAAVNPADLLLRANSTLVYGLT